MEFSSSAGFFLAVMIALSMTLQMQTPAAAISCDPIDTSLMTRSSADNCRKDLQNQCVLQGREASKSEFNAFPTNQDKNKCEGCCQVPLPTSPPPPPAPVDWKKCRAGDTDKSFKLNGGREDCKRCFDSCETKCRGIGIGVRAADQVCLWRRTTQTNAFLGLTCTCCCRARIVLPPTPPLALFGPPPPLPLTPASDNICRPEDTSVAFTLSNSRGCSFCPGECESKCTAIGTSVVQQQCTPGSSSRCKCCCRDNTSPPPPPPSPLPLPPFLPPLLAPPPPSNRNIFNGRSCRFCETDCESRCSRERATMTMQMCTVETNSVFCECCCTTN
ncbi:hypothetical protein MKW98_001500 [Papaver atlanticum]|uniref:Uncharacterized protein n=1 Tax=Papaver atlanticum TaxID=357466 RepID=A0AAD4SXJ7_9MAGN|nr:hypothetical protein MKW98_001500 [Papaver atlanticum]